MSDIETRNRIGELKSTIDELYNNNIVPKTPRAGVIVGDNTTTLIIPESYSYSLEVRDTDDSAIPQFTGGTHQSISIGADIVIPEESTLVVPARPDNQCHPTITTNPIPVGVVLIYSYIPR